MRHKIAEPKEIPAPTPLYTDMRERGIMRWDNRDYLTFFGADEVNQRYMLGINDYNALGINIQRHAHRLITELNHINDSYNELKRKKLEKGEFE